MNNRRVKLLVFSFIISLVLTGCGSVPEFWGTPNPDYLELVDISDCWNAICPGITDREQTEHLLLSLPLGGGNGIEEIKPNNSLALSLDFQRFESSKALVEFDDSGQIVESVVISLGKNELTIEQVVNLLGEPQAVMVATQSSIGDSSNTFPSYVLLYPESRLVVWSGIYNAGLNPQSEDIVLHPTLAVTSLDYVEKETEYLFDQLVIWLDTDRKPANNDDLKRFLHPWPGFGNTVPLIFDYDEYMP